MLSGWLIFASESLYLTLTLPIKFIGRNTNYGWVLKWYKNLLIIILAMQYLLSFVLLEFQSATPLKFGVKNITWVSN